MSGQADVWAASSAASGRAAQRLSYPPGTLWVGSRSIRAECPSRPGGDLARGRATAGGRKSCRNAPINVDAPILRPRLAQECEQVGQALYAVASGLLVHGRHKDATDIRNA